MPGRFLVGAPLAVAMLFAATPALAQPGGVIQNGSNTQPDYIRAQDQPAAGVPGLFVNPLIPGFLFEPETPYASLKEVPIWNELEQMLDNPYAVAYDPTTPGNYDGYPAYRTTFARRPNITAGTSLLAPGAALRGLLVHPLNYNPASGEEMRLLNSGYPGGPWMVPDQLYQPAPVLQPLVWVWSYRQVQVSPGSSRVLDTAIDYNGPEADQAHGGDPNICIANTETVPPEGTTLCGYDPGEPGYLGFGVFNANGYSTPAIRGVASPSTPLSSLGTGQNRLYDSTRGFINARNPGGVGGLHKPSIRIQEAGGNSQNPNYQINTDPNNVLPSNENDYYRPASVAAANQAGFPAGAPNRAAMTGRNAAIALGKSLFWDMQVGSDCVQSCGTCHFTGAGIDTRTKNQINPNHLGGDFNIDLHGINAANQELTIADFPFHKLTNPNLAGDPAAATPIVAHVNGGNILSNTPTAFGFDGVNAVTGTKETGVTMTVADAGNIIDDINDVASSMGVIYGTFEDIVAPGAAAFSLDPSGVKSLLPDIRRDPTDPLPVFQGFRRVEPRNTPTMQAAGFNFDNFWDGRARHDFNGGSVFGASDPQSHVWVTNGVGQLVATRQIIKFASIASLATGPALSEFEMSFQGRNWQKIGKKLLQAGVTPLANQLVDPTDSVLGPFSGQRSTVGGAVDRPGRPGLNVTYEQLIKAAYFPALWGNTSQHLNGNYTPNNFPHHIDHLTTASVPILSGGAVVNSPDDPFDGFVLTGPAAGAAAPADTFQFRQMEANFSLFWGLSVHAWVQILIPDNTPFDQFLDKNPDAYMGMADTTETLLVNDLLNCSSSGQRNAPRQTILTPDTDAGLQMGACFTEVGNFKRDPDVVAYINATAEGGGGATAVPSGGTRNPATDPDPLLGMDIFFASNLSLKNPGYRSGRCGACHNMPTLTDNTLPFTFKAQLPDFASEFSPNSRGVELLVEPLGRLRIISGFLLESEISENGQDAVERRFINQSIVPRASDGIAYPGGLQNPNGPDGIPGTDDDYIGADQAFLDNGVYNIGVRPISEDLGRGGLDAFNWPLSLATLLLKNLGGTDFEPGNPIMAFDPSLGPEGGLFEESAQDQQINPGGSDEPVNPQLPPYLAPFCNGIVVGDAQPDLDEPFAGINTLTDAAMLEGFADVVGPFNPAAAKNEGLNNGTTQLMGTWPTPNRVLRDGAFKAPQLRDVELTGPYFHNGGKLTLRQVVDFYVRGGDFPVSNAEHRDFLMVNFNVEQQSNLSEEEKVALVDFLLELTDDRVRFQQAPFDHPEVIIPIDGTAPDNTLGRAAMLAATVPVTDPVTGAVITPALYRDIPAVGAAGDPITSPQQGFLGIKGMNPATHKPIARLVGQAAFDVHDSHYSH